MLNILMTILNYINLRSVWQSQAMQDSQNLQDLQMQSSNEQAELMRKQTAEEELVEMELDGMDDISTEAYTEALKKMSEIASKYDTLMRTLLAKNQAKEREIEQQINAREPKIQAVDADIESLEETLDKRTEENFDYGMMVS